MRWFERRKRRKFKPFDRSALPEVVQAPFDEMVEDGLMMAESAGRLALKNRFIVQALRGDEPWDDQRAAAAAREVLYELVQEANETAEYSAEERELASRREGRSVHQHDYHRADALNLRRREKVYAEIREGRIGDRLADQTRVPASPDARRRNQRSLVDDLRDDRLSDIVRGRRIGRLCAQRAVPQLEHVERLLRPLADCAQQSARARPSRL